jgi:isoamylase
MIESSHISAGCPHPQGATWDGEGTTFALFSEHATAVELCVFDPDDPMRERDRVPMWRSVGSIWHCYVRGVGPGSPYGFRVDGPFRPEDGHRFNPAKLLLDPYAKAISGSVDWSAPVYGQRIVRRAGEAKPDRRDSGGGMPKSIVVDPYFDWKGDALLRTPWNRTIIYEAHVKGLTKQFPGVFASLQGTYAGLVHPCVLDHLTRLGITAVELLPVHAFMDDDFLVRRGLTQYWGYNTLGFFAPEGRYSATGDGGQQVSEFKTMVRSLHVAGIEVILDVVYNHTGEGGRFGPTLCFRGIDNRTYYRLIAGDLSHYEDLTGTGNTLNVFHPQVLKLVMDSLRYWVEEMHVDGFRFDLAPALGRAPDSFEQMSPFLQAIHQDPVLSTVKLIAEPWDLGESGYQLGHFPSEWREWNDRFRDAVRRFWRADRGMVGEVGFRVTGSADVYQASRRGPLAGVNFVAAHDGFTLRDLVSYERKHNLANRELNQDGADYNHSWNNGVEGASADDRIVAARKTQIKSLIGTLLIAQGVPMLCAGDEFGRTQKGNNNPYCQDNPTSWIDWTLDEVGRDILAFTTEAIRLRKSSEALTSSAFPRGKRTATNRLPDIAWFRPDGKLMTGADWANADRRAISYRLVVDAESADERPAPLFVALNGEVGSVAFKAPGMGSRIRGGWKLALASGEPAPPTTVAPGRSVELPDRSLAVYRFEASE